MMLRARKISIWSGALGGILVLALVGFLLFRARRPIRLEGAAIREDADPRKQSPIADVRITADNGLGTAVARSDSSGFFSLTLQSGIKSGWPVTLRFRHPDYKPLELKGTAGATLFLARMTPILRETPAESTGPETVIANIRIRYSTKTTTVADIGSAVKIFEVVNAANVPCHGQSPCSPDGKWKAAIASASLDAGEGNEFRNARVSCIAGPCPFTRIEHNGFSGDGRDINVSVRNWSGTATFLVEAEVSHPMVGSLIRTSYPAIVGPALDFSVPPAAEGTSIEAELNGTAIVFPLGPDLRLSWANCKLTVDNDKSKLYRCELKPGYRFR